MTRQYHSLCRAHHKKCSHHLSPDRIVTLLTVFSMLYSLSPSLSCYNWKFVALNPFTRYVPPPYALSSGNHRFVVFMYLRVFMSLSLLLVCSFVFFFFLGPIYRWTLTVFVLLSDSFQLASRSVGPSMHNSMSCLFRLIRVVCFPTDVCIGKCCCSQSPRILPFYIIL